MTKLTQNGYLTIDIDGSPRSFRFNMNAWWNLQQNTGNDLAFYAEILAQNPEEKLDLRKKEHRDIALNKAAAMAEILHAGAMAFDQEEKNPIDYDIYNIRSWFGPHGINESNVEDIIKAILWNSTNPKPSEGKV